jgi:hypothetical protein
MPTAFASLKSIEASDRFSSNFAVPQKILVTQGNGHVAMHGSLSVS